MEIRGWHCYIIINCVLIYYLEAKTFSLNEAIALESQQQQASETSPQVIQENTVRRRTPYLKSRKNREQANALPNTRKISPLKYRKTFQITSPLKPRKLKPRINLRHKRKNQSVKREINGNEKLKQKYIPLLKSLSLLFDNLLGSDTSESFEVKNTKYKRNRYHFDTAEESDDCACEQIPYATNAESRPQETTITSTPSIAAEISINTKDVTIIQTTAAPTTNTSPGNFSRVKPNKNVSILFPRNTFSSQRNYNEFSERSSTTHNRNAKGYIAGDNGDREYNARFRENGSYTESNKEDTDDASRDYARGDEFTGRIRGNGSFSRNSKNRATTDEVIASKDENADVDIRKNKFETRRNETKGATPISESIRRLRGFVSEKKVGSSTESIYSKEIHEESIIDVSFNSANDQRVIGRSSPDSEENQDVRTRDEAVMPFKYKSHTNAKQANAKSPVVMIFDGYSVTRDKNGENRLAEKSIRFHS